VGNGPDDSRRPDRPSRDERTRGGERAGVGQDMSALPATDEDHRPRDLSGVSATQALRVLLVHILISELTPERVRAARVTGVAAVKTRDNHVP
jgi:hypothetical protein